MRKALSRMKGRDEYSATVGRFGKKHGWDGGIVSTILLLDIRCKDGTRVCQHCWSTLHSGFSCVDLAEGDRFLFRGTSGRYETPTKTDFCLKYIKVLNKIKKIYISPKLLSASTDRKGRPLSFESVERKYDMLTSKQKIDGYTLLHRCGF